MRTSVGRGGQLGEMGLTYRLHIFVVGCTEGDLGSSNVGQEDALILALDDNGVVRWIRQLGGTGDDCALGVTVGADDTAYAVGYISNALPGHTQAGLLDAFLMAFDAVGSTLWTEQMGLAAGSDTEFMDIAVTSNDDLVVGGVTDSVLPGESNSGGYDSIVLRYDADGALLWTTQFGTVGYEYVQSLSLGPADEIYVVGNTSGAMPGHTASGQEDGYMMSLDPNGGTRWVQQVGYAGADGFTGTAVDLSGGILTCGYTSGPLPGQTQTGRYDGFVMRLDANGERP